MTIAVLLRLVWNPILIGKTKGADIIDPSMCAVAADGSVGAGGLTQGLPSL